MDPSSLSSGTMFLILLCLLPVFSKMVLEDRKQTNMKWFPKAHTQERDKPRKLLLDLQLFCLSTIVSLSPYSCLPLALFIPPLSALSIDFLLSTALLFDPFYKK